ncbi:MAG: hypothetical protein H0X29_01295 [Parachlamydiaceae bacterium]|nr:hypothetical protein [Parachlamydiaceae bacterium]
MSPFSHANKLVPTFKDRSLLFIIGGVVIGHVLLLLWASLMHSEVKPLSQLPQRRLIVQTITLNQGSSTIAEITPLPKPERIKKEIISKEIKGEEQEINKITEFPPITPLLEPQNSLAEETVPEVVKPVVSMPEIKEPPPPIAEIPAPEVPAPEIKVEKITKPIEPIPKLVPKDPIKPLQELPPVIKAVPKKPEPLKKKKEVEQPVVKKAVAKAIPPTPSKAETAKKEIAVKAPEKKIVAQIPSQQDKLKKAEAEKAALERQRKIEAEQQAAKAKQQKLLSQAQETIAKMDNNRDKLSRSNFSDTNFTSPGAITSLQIDSFSSQGKPQQLSSPEAAYRDELASRLKLLLKLPEYGEVKIKLILERSGKVSKIIVVSTASVANRKYIEKTLQTITFPPFGANFDQSPQFTFSITLCNDL